MGKKIVILYTQEGLVTLESRNSDSDSRTYTNAGKETGLRSLLAYDSMMRSPECELGAESAPSLGQRQGGSKFALGFA